MNEVILLNKRPVGKPALDDFKFSSEAIPIPLAGDVLLKTLYVSVDPYLRGRMNDSKSYAPSFEIGKPIQSRIIAQVIDSFYAEFKKGDFVSFNKLVYFKTDISFIRFIGSHLGIECKYSLRYYKFNQYQDINSYLSNSLYNHKVCYHLFVFSHFEPHSVAWQMPFE